ncbi:hypothetical protein Tco_1035544 [Tanacetum coccineum]
MAGYKHTQLKNKSFEEIQMLFDKEMKRVNSFVPMDSEVVKGNGKKIESSRKETVSKKRTIEELDEESVKRQKLEDNAEKAELQRCLEIVPRDDEAINIIRADGSEKYYKIFTTMLDDFDRQDMLDLYRLVKERFETTSPKGYDRLLWGDLVTLFEPSEEDEICRAQQDYTLISWRKYPLTQEMLSRMLSRRLEVDHECEMAYELLRFTRSQLKKKYSNSLLLLVVKLLLLVLVTTARRVSAVSYKYLHTINFDQLHAYLEQHELHANEVRIMRKRNQDPLALIDSGLAVPVFKQGDDPIDAINKMMSFLSTVVTVQPVQGRQSSFAASTSGTRANISRICRNNSGQQRVMKRFNCQGEGHMESLVDPGVAEGPIIQTVITHNAAYQADDLDAYDSDCDEISTAKAFLMANLSSYGADVLSEVPISDNTNNDMINQSVHEMPYSESSHFVEHPENEIYSTREKLIINDIIRDKDAQFADFENEINSLKQTLSEQLKEKESLTKIFNVFKNESKEKEARNIDKEIALEKKVKELNNIKAQQIRPMLYDGSVIAKETNVISIADSKETLMLEEESRSKMVLKQSDPMVLEKKVNIKHINYAELNRLSEDFGKHFIPQQELSDEQALHPITDQFVS